MEQEERHNKRNSQIPSCLASPKLEDQASQQPEDREPYQNQNRADCKEKSLKVSFCIRIGVEAYITKQTVKGEQSPRGVFYCCEWSIEVSDGLREGKVERNDGCNDLNIVCENTCDDSNEAFFLFVQINCNEDGDVSDDDESECKDTKRIDVRIKAVGAYIIRSSFIFLPFKLNAALAKEARVPIRAIDRELISRIEPSKTGIGVWT